VHDAAGAIGLAIAVRQWRLACTVSTSGCELGDDAEEER